MNGLALVDEADSKSGIYFSRRFYLYKSCSPAIRAHQNVALSDHEVVMLPRLARLIGVRSLCFGVLHIYHLFSLTRGRVPEYYEKELTALAFY
jgi:hypothetical protein